MSQESAPPSTPKSRALILTLGLIAMLSGLLVILASQLTLPRITLNKQRALERAIFSVLPEATTRTNYHLDASGLQLLPEEASSEANVFAGYDQDGNLAGLAMEASARGYQDIVKILFGYSLKSECVIGITILQSTETPGLGDKVGYDPAFQANFNCLEARLNDSGTAMAHDIVTVKNGKKTEPWQIDGISGATVTSTAIGKALRQSTNELLPLLHKYQDNLAQKYSD